MTVHAPQVAGTFYPEDPDSLRAAVDEYLAAAQPQRTARAIIAPHAGYVYSGAIAGTAYRAAEPGIRRVLLLGPAHFDPLRGMATHSADTFATPLGNVAVDIAARDRLGAPVNDDAFVREHSLEVHLPFLQCVLGEFTVVPVLVGETEPADVADALERAGINDETLIVISSDLSHFLDYETARERDRATATRIEAGEPVGPYDACGCRSIAALHEVARRHGWSITLLDLRNSGDTAGDRQRVVGYGAFAAS